MVDNLKKRIGARVYNIRFMIGESQDYIAAMLGIKRQQYQRYEKGIYSFKVTDLAFLAEQWNISMDYLCCLTDEFKPIDSSKPFFEKSPEEYFGFKKKEN